MRRRTRHNPPKGQPGFIKFSEVQQGYLQEVLRRQRREFNEAVQTVYEELGIMEQVLNAPPGKYVMRRDRSGLDVIPTAELKKEKDPGPETK